MSARRSAVPGSPTRVRSAARALRVALVFAGACACTAPPRDVASEIDRLARETLELGPVQGMAIAVLRSGCVSYEGAWGYADAMCTQPVGPATPFDIASVTKVFTSVLVLQLVEEGALALDDPLGHVLPELDSSWRALTLRHLLTQTSGVPEYMAEGDPAARARGRWLDAAWIVDWLSRQAPRFPAGERWEYSNTNFLLARVVAERAAGADASRLFAERIAARAGLERFGPCHEPPLRAQHRLFEVREGRIGPARAALETPVLGDGGLCASARDLARALEAVFEGPLLGDAARAEAMAPAATSFGPVGYGLGLRMGSTSGHKKWGHTGGSERVWAAAAHYPDVALTVVVLLDTDAFFGPGAQDLEARVARIVLDLPEPRFDEVPLDAARLRALCGTFEQTEETETSRWLRFVEGGVLLERDLRTGAVHPLRHLGGGVFGDPDWGELRLVSDLDEDPARRILVTSGGFFYGVAYRTADEPEGPPRAR